MALNIKNPEADKLARDLADKTGENLTQVVINALKECLQREEGRNSPMNISVKDLFHYGIDHVLTAGYLFTLRPIVPIVNCGCNRTHITLDSAAYLSYIGIEQILKGCLLWEMKNFKPGHGIEKIIKKIKFLQGKFSDQDKKIIKQIDQFEKARYPKNYKSKDISVGQEHWIGIEHILDLIIDAMPDELYDIYEASEKEKDYIRKGDRILLKKKID